ncbi:hypothetical protein L1887_11648 [Cichorium endivia]|nr:hypothetical protein L1887_11648 [Cichorium endivia]
MQGQKGTIGNLPEGLTMEHGSNSSDSSVIEQQICWNNYIRNPPNQETQNIGMWSMGESSSNSVSQDRSSHSPLFVQSLQSSHLETIPHNVTVNVNVNPSTFIPIKPSTFPGSSSSNPFEIDGQGQGQGQGHLRHLPCKRKATELSVGQSSSSNMFQNPNPVNDLPSDDQIIPRLGLGVGQVSSDVENTRRNVRIRINNSRQQEPSNLSIPIPNPSLRLNSIDLRSPPVVAITPENSNSLSQESQPALRVPPLRRNAHGSSRWNRNRTSSDNSRTIPTNISDHPLFVPPQNTINWNLNSAAANPVPTSSSVIPNLPLNRGSPNYPSRRLSEILRRSLLSSMDSGGGGGGQGGNLFPRVPPGVGTSESGIPAVVGIPGHHHHRHHLLPHSRSSDRLVDGAFGFPYLARNVAGGSEGRGRLVSEIRNVLDLIRRGEGLRFEDVMILDQSVFYGMADIHDRHRDMRLDIDNMSYEELLALEERIGNVNTGLTEEKISICLKQKKYVTKADTEPCCICQEEYKNGDDLGGLECGHDFHTSCIKQWLLQKNLCPVCKSAAIANSK